jgi:3-hydroxyacyl-[acyl-carrier-protein] dehydratase
MTMLGTVPIFVRRKWDCPLRKYKHAGELFLWEKLLAGQILHNVNIARLPNSFCRRYNHNLFQWRIRGVMRKDLWIVEPSRLQNFPIVADIDEIRRFNPQRFEMEQLTAVVYEDVARHICVGYKDVRPDEFWVRGHAPGMPVMPPTLVCEAAAQLASFYALKHRLYASQGGFLGMKNVHCRQIVRSGDRLYLMIKLLKIRGAVVTCRFQCVVRDRLACDGVIMGSVFSWDKDAARAPKKSVG